MVPLFDFFEPDLHITRFDTLNGESNPLVFRQIDFLQRLEHAVLVKCVQLSHAEVLVFVENPSTQISTIEGMIKSTGSGLGANRRTE